MKTYPIIFHIFFYALIFFIIGGSSAGWTYLILGSIETNSIQQPRKECHVTYDSEVKIPLNYPKGYEGYYVYIACPINKK